MSREPEEPRGLEAGISEMALVFVDVEVKRLRDTARTLIDLGDLDGAKAALERAVAIDLEAETSLRAKLKTRTNTGTEPKDLTEKPEGNQRDG